MGVIRHVDAGYDRAVEVAKERGVRIPMKRVPLTKPAKPSVDCSVNAVMSLEKGRNGAIDGGTRPNPSDLGRSQ